MHTPPQHSALAITPRRVFGKKRIAASLDERPKTNFLTLIYRIHEHALKKHIPDFQLAIAANKLNYPCSCGLKEDIFKFSSLAPS